MTRAEILRNQIARKERALEGYRNHPELFADSIERAEKELAELKERLEEAGDE